MPRRLLPDALRDHAAHQPTTRAFAFVDDRGGEEAELTYGDLHARSLAVAAELARRCRPGDRAILLFPPGLDFIVAFFGCQYAHVIPVPLSPPRRNRGLDAALHIFRDSEPAAVLTVAAVEQLARPFLETEGRELLWVAVDQVDAADRGFEPQPCQPDEVALLQYTSGSTSDPKGVMVSQGNLLANQEMIEAGFGHDRASTVVGWTPLFHDQGLIGNVLQPIHLGTTCILMSPITFIRWPLVWLSTISRYRAHTSGGPNFAYDACVARAPGSDLGALDLSCWKVAFNGAEPIRHETMAQFAETFAPYGFRTEAFYPCYGLAEATLLVTGSRKGRGPRRLDALAGSGRVLPGEEVVIVDPATGRRCAPGEIGEIWLAGDHIAPGYWRRPDATAATFGARTADGQGGPYLRTGDLGQVVDGELYVRGRLKDLIIVRGRNHYPQDVEHSVQSAHPALKARACAAFAVAGPSGEQVVVVQEVRRDRLRTADPADIMGAIRAAVLRDHELALGDLVLTQPGALEMTTSGKIRRATAKDRYLAGRFEIWEPSREDIDDGPVGTGKSRLPAGG